MAGLLDGILAAAQARPGLLANPQSFASAYPDASLLASQGPAMATAAPAQAMPQQAQMQAQGAPQQNAPSGGLLGAIGRGIGNIVSIPFDMANGYAAEWKAVPQKLAFEQQQRQLTMQMAQRRMALMNSVMSGNTGLFGAPSAAAPPAGAPPAAAMPPISPPMLPQSAPAGNPVPGGVPDVTALTPPQIGAPQSGAPPQMPGSIAPPSAAPRITPPQLSGLDLRNPNAQRTIAALDLLGDPAGAQLTTLGTALMPKYVGVRPGGAVFNPVANQYVGGTLPNDLGVSFTPDGNGGFTTNTAANAGTLIPAMKAAQAAATTIGNDSGHLINARALAAANSGGTAQGEAPYQIIKVPLRNGSTIDMPLSTFKTLQASGKFPGLGQSQTPGEEQDSKDDAVKYNNTFETYASGPAVMKEQNAHDITMQALRSAQALDPNAFTATAGEAAKIGNLIGVPGANTLTNNIQTYEALLPQVLRGTFSTFPRLEKEFEVVKSASANVNTPKDAASILLATQAATHERNLAYAEFRSNWQGAHSQQAVDNAFNNSPAGRASMFASPAFHGLQIGGRPAVQIGNHPLKDGHVYGIFMPGTKNAQPFMVQ